MIPRGTGSVNRQGSTHGMGMARTALGRRRGYSADRNVAAISTRSASFRGFTARAPAWTEAEPPSR
jgi:hypothetical protein